MVSRDYNDVRINRCLPFLFHHFHHTESLTPIWALFSFASGVLNADVYLQSLFFPLLPDLTLSLFFPSTQVLFVIKSAFSVVEVFVACSHSRART
ncbi:hypothetical protein GALMADRAFT_1214880 [Galerina marginata CBS 339.88]|uniref:Uncharacterized protein n=1 Tax=Galerina marginata (strain CBS 339.88) TaxID=685588 RepID=A0A067S558_GALM3|nr:hypothetical protein GALMADRAFT_1214880 [Galerina marginata CBS 339.88]